jgi:hypothetical protein
MNKLPPKNIYLAGKISKNCWRHPLVPGLRSMDWSDAPVKCKDYDYVGPFFTGCDHGCYHGPASHGNLNPGLGCGFPVVTQLQVRSHCINAVTVSDILFAYIDAPDCYGTVIEIGHALSSHIPVAIAFAPNMTSKQIKDMWLFACAAQRVDTNVSEADLPALLNEIVRDSQ